MFAEYTGEWTFEAAAHLLRRTTFGPRKERILQALNEGFDQTFETLFSDPEPVDPPIYYDFEDDPAAAIGETWTDKTLDGDITGWRHTSGWPYVAEHWTQFWDAAETGP